MFLDVVRMRLDMGGSGGVESGNEGDYHTEVQPSVSSVLVSGKRDRVGKRPVAEGSNIEQTSGNPC